MFSEVSDDKSGSESNAEDHPRVSISILADHQTKTTIRIPPPNYPIEIFEDEKALPSGIKFKVKSDDKEAKTKETDDRGTIKIYKPQSKVELTLSTEKDAPPPKKEQRRATGEDDIPTPIRVK